MHRPVRTLRDIGGLVSFRDGHLSFMLFGSVMHAKTEQDGATP